MYILSYPQFYIMGEETCNRQESGHISLDSLTLDFGTIGPDSIAEGKIEFSNSGDAPLQIISIFSDCGCTSTRYPTDPVEPGEKGEILIRFNPKGRLPGPFRRVLRIRSNGDNPRVSLSVKGVVGAE